MFSIVSGVQILSLLPEEMLLGPTLRRAREALGFSRAALTELTGINQNSIAKYELHGLDGGQPPPLERLVRLAVVLRLDPRDLFIAACQTPEEVEYFENLDNQHQQMLGEVQRYMDTIMTVMASAAWKQMGTKDQPNPVTDFLAKQFAKASMELQNGKGQNFLELIKNDPSHEGPGRDKSPTNEKAVPAASFNSDPKGDTN